jgi:hypothetical protein
MTGPQAGENPYEQASRNTRTAALPAAWSGYRPDSGMSGLRPDSGN